MEKKIDKSVHILVHAAHIFADVGYKSATIRQICRSAKVNVASINYYFNDKQNLYAEVLKYGVSELFKKHPLFIDDLSEQDPELLIRKFIGAFFTHVCENTENSWIIRIILRELIEPTGMLDIFIENITVPVVEKLSTLIHNLSDHLTFQQARLCTASIMCQCVHFYNARAIIAKIAGYTIMTPEGISAVSSHIADFSTAAIKNMPNKEEK